MKRDIARFRKKFDVLIIGAGIYGSAVAYEAASRGLRTALVDRGDFGAETSANSLKIFHGGLRSLQYLDFPLMRQMIHEQKVLRRIAPHLVHPMPVLLPLYKRRLKGKTLMRGALLATDIVGMDRNRDIPDDKKLPGGRVISDSQLKRFVPALNREKTNGAAMWHDAIMHDSERLTLAFVKSAASFGATVANHVEAVDLGDRLFKDHLTKESFTIDARVIMNCTGPWIEELTGNKASFCKAFNLLIDRQIADVALGLGPENVNVTQKERRFGKIFIVPWKEKTLVGCYFSDHPANDQGLEEHEIQEFLQYVNKLLPETDIKRKEVIKVLKGLLPVDKDMRLQRRYEISVHGNIIDVRGVKYTTARWVAQRAVDKAFRLLGRKQMASMSDKAPLAGGDIQNFTDFLKKAKDKDLAQRHGRESERIIRPRMHKIGSTFKEEIAYCLEDEMAMKLSDMMRRTGLCETGLPETKTLEQVAKIMAKYHGWSKDRMKKELEELG